MSLREDCAGCGHDIDSHHEKQYSCLAMRCECKRYVPAATDKVPETERDPIVCSPNGLSLSDLIGDSGDWCGSNGPWWPCTRFDEQ